MEKKCYNCDRMEEDYVKVVTKKFEYRFCSLQCVADGINKHMSEIIKENEVVN